MENERERERREDFLSIHLHTSIMIYPRRKNNHFLCDILPRKSFDRSIWLTIFFSLLNWRQREMEVLGMFKCVSRRRCSVLLSWLDLTWLEYQYKRIHYSFLPNSIQQRSTNQVKKRTRLPISQIPLRCYTSTLKLMKMMDTDDQITNMS